MHAFYPQCVRRKKQVLQDEVSCSLVKRENDLSEPIELKSSANQGYFRGSDLFDIGISQHSIMLQ